MNKKYIYILGLIIIVSIASSIGEVINRDAIDITKIDSKITERNNKQMMTTIDEINIDNYYLMQNDYIRVEWSGRINNELILGEYVIYKDDINDNAMHNKLLEDSKKLALESFNRLRKTQEIKLDIEELKTTK